MGKDQPNHVSCSADAADVHKPARAVVDLLVDVLGDLAQPQGDLQWAVLLVLQRGRRVDNFVLFVEGKEPSALLQLEQLCKARDVGVALEHTLLEQEVGTHHLAVDIGVLEVLVPLAIQAGVLRASRGVEVGVLVGEAERVHLQVLEG